MALPKFSELSTTVQIVSVLAVAAALWGASEYLLLQPVVDSNAKKKTQADSLAKELEPLRPYEQRRKQLEADNQRLELQLANLKQIVPDEKEVDSFIRLVEGASAASGVGVRRFTAKPNVAQDYYVEVPFEMEIDGPYYEVLDFFDRLSKMARIVNVSDLKIGGIQSGKSVGNKPYAYNPNETVAGICTITSFFSREEEAPAAAKPGQPAKPPQPQPQKK
jgi:type IV pilus assembly protein PilO